MNKGLKRSSLVFYLLAMYVLFQFFWWAFHIIQLEEALRDLSILGVNDPLEIKVLQDHYISKVYMVVGEGAVFAILLLLGVWQIQRFFLKDAALANKERNFMLAVTHELKTPIATLRLLLQTMSRSGVSQEQSSKMQLEAIDETHRLEHLVQNILLSTRLEELEKMDKSPIDVAQLIQNCTLKMQRIAGAKKVIQTEITGDPFFYGDVMMIESMLMNLLDNAVKYSPEEGTIQVASSCDKLALHINVMDRGDGVDVSEKEKIFEKFYRVGSEDTRTTKGTGLGLFIVKKIVSMHAGTVAVESREGGGSNFSVMLPIMNRI